FRYYCTLTIRESILTINGSRCFRIKGWWVAHHYLSCVLSGMVLTWRDGECYQEFRPQFMYFVLYIAFIQILQFFQLYNAYSLWYLSYDCEGEWQVFALSCMFFILAVGNIVTTSLVILKKLRTSSSYNYVIGITRKYSSMPYKRGDEKKD
ncbi:unnamed protein product, partial [Nippostrongylus brasiliensis]|uniref:Transmembrane protein 120 homolog (inferred by orthology to a D. melanogaster protein) n=1 Tax=Nippostrongylus brasiliensis TaxID=27835 RepID=A0A0N4XIR9_NIPBR